MINLPFKSVMVGGHRIKLSVDEMADWGEFCPDRMEITLSVKALENWQAFESTLEHEVGHAARCIGGIADLKAYEDEAIQRNHDYLFSPAWKKIQQRIQCVRKRKQS